MRFAYPLVLLASTLSLSFGAVVKRADCGGGRSASDAKVHANRGPSKRLAFSPVFSVLCLVRRLGSPTVGFVSRMD